MFYVSIPEVKTGCDGLAGDADVQTIKVILWVAVRRTFVQVTVPLDQNGNGTSLENTTVSVRNDSSSNKVKSDTNQCAQILELVASSTDDVAQAEDWTVGGDLLIVAAAPQIVHVSRLQNVGPWTAELVINRCVSVVMD